MGDAVLADSQGLTQLRVSGARLNEAFNNALDVETSSLWLPRSMQEAWASNDAWPGQNKRRLQLEDVGRDLDLRQVKFPRQEQIHERLGSQNAFLADRHVQTPLATGVWNNGAFNFAPDHLMTPGWTTPQVDRELACRAAVALPGSQTPGVAVNGEALHSPQLKLPSYDPSTVASGSNAQKILTEVSAGTNLMTARKTAYCVLTREKNTTQVKPKSKRFKCDECTQRTGKAVTFSCKKDLRRHLYRTNTHNAPPVARCSKCGKTVTRLDGMQMHRNSCQGSTILL